MSFEDRELTCIECGGTFVFAADQQEYFAQKGYADPKRCPSCRTARKAAGGAPRRGPGGGGGRPGGRGPGGGGGGGGGGRGPGGPRYGGGGGGPPRGRAPRQLFDVTCAACGKETQVPFEPKGDRPVYCRECYEAQRSG